MGVKQIIKKKVGGELKRKQTFVGCGGVVASGGFTIRAHNASSRKGESRIPLFCLWHIT